METLKILPFEAPSTDGIHILKGLLALPEGAPKGYFQIVHGMQEYVGRYETFMLRMAQEGYLVFGEDHLGHGHTAVNDVELGFIAHKDGWKYLVSDVYAFADAVRNAHPFDIPYYLMGHSMGSFIVRAAVMSDRRPDKLIVMGTGGPNPATPAGLAMIDVIKAFKGEKHISNTVENLAFSTYNQRFADEKDPVAWLSKDLSVREKYRADKFCSYKFTVSAMKDLLKVNQAANSAAWFRAMGEEKDGRKLPILLVSGAEDPVGNYGEGVRVVWEKLQKAGADVQIKLYMDCRHEILNDTCREETIRDILAFLC